MKMIGNTDYFMNWPNVADNSPTWQSNRHNTKQANMQGGLLYYGISVLIP